MTLSLDLAVAELLAADTARQAVTGVGLRVSDRARQTRVEAAIVQVRRAWTARQWPHAILGRDGTTVHKVRDDGRLACEGADGAKCLVVSWSHVLLDRTDTVPCDACEWGL